jgi:D-3-phosphoglycerate dehydrogenase / 2-oxoglutarate reductase
MTGSTPDDRSLTVTAIGDSFVRSDLMVQAMERHLGQQAYALAFRVGEVDWPAQPLVDAEGVEECLGDPAWVAALASDAYVLVTHVAPVSASVIEACPRLKIIACCRGGPSNINVEAATARGIPVVNAPARNAQAVVEFTLGLILAEYRGIGRAHCALSNGEWLGELYRYDRTGRELRGQTIGLVGFGAIARILVPYLRPFELRVLAYDPFVSADRMAELGVEKHELDDLLEASDIVSLHARVTPTTVGLIGAAQINRMKKGAYLINTARGPLVDYDALYKALANGHLAGAGLDTFPMEPPPSEWPLLKLPNVTLTPHVAGSSRESAERGADIVAREVARYFAGHPMSNCVNPAVVS